MTVISIWVKRTDVCFVTVWAFNACTTALFQVMHSIYVKGSHWGKKSRQLLQSLYDLL